MLFGTLTPMALQRKRMGQITNPDLMRQPMQGTPEPAAMPMTPMEPEAKPGLGTRLLGEGWENKMGAVGAMLMGDKNAVQRHQVLQQQQQQALEQHAAEQRARQQQYTIERQDGWEDWQRREQWKLDNPTPSAPGAFEQAMAGAGIDPSSTEGQQLYRARVESMTRDPNDEFVVVPLPGGRTYAGPRSGLGGAMGGTAQSAPTTPVGRLTPIGGDAGSNASGGFRR